MSNLLQRMKESGSLKADTISSSIYFKPKDIAQTLIPIINIACTGNLDGGLASGSTIIAGPSKHFKSLLGLLLVGAYMKKHKDAICVFYDSEFGITPDYLASHNIDCERVLHIPIMHVEQLKFDMVKKLNDINRGDHVIFFTDSLGNLASKKEVEDAVDEKSVADMSRAKAIKSFFRIITPMLNIKDVPAITINHVYEEQGMFAKTIMSGGTGVTLAANNVWFVGRSQEKDSASKLIGYTFTITSDKSRFVKEKSKFSFTVSFEGGINRWSGLLDIAVEAGYVVKPSKGWFSKIDPTTGEVIDKKYREDETNTNEFWIPLVSDKAFREFIRNKFQLATAPLQQEEPIEVEVAPTTKTKGSK